MNLNLLIPYLPYLVGGGVALAILLALSFARRGQRAQLRPEKLLNRSSDWEIPQSSFGERRGSVRREGTVVKVLLSSPTFKKGVDSGYVLDRSTGGMKIAMGVAVAPGSTVQVRAQNAPDTIPWVTIVIRSCRRSDNGKHFELGCEFEKPPPWNVLLLFG